MIWPVNGPITSPFCERRAWEACHPGIDIGVPSGTPIRAALGGRVALAGADGRLRQLHLHPAHRVAVDVLRATSRSIGVSVGQQVSQGQVIGIVRLHRPVLRRRTCTSRCAINGAVTNPLNYL